MDTQLLIVVAILVVVLAAVLAWSYYQNQRRLKQMRDVAARLGYEFDEKGAGLVDRLGGFALLSQGNSRQVNSLLRTEADGAAATIFDHSYYTGVGKNRRTHRQSALLFESERLDLTAFTLRPEGLGQKLLGLAGQQDIDFEEQPDFSAAYLLQGPDEQQIRTLFSGDKLDFFARRPGMCVEGNGQKLLYYRAGKRLSPKAIPSFMEEGLAVLRLLAG